MESEQLVSPSQQCSCTPVKDFLEEHNMKTLEHPPYSPDLATADFYQFPPLQLALNGTALLKFY
jgi:hypothetical protein